MNSSMDHWEKMLSLIEKIRSGERDDLREVLSSGSASEVVRVLHEESDMTLLDIQHLYKDLEDTFGVYAAPWVPYITGHDFEERLD